jgi:pentapeptide MXKDX repeat protein
VRVKPRIDGVPGYQQDATVRGSKRSVDRTVAFIGPEHRCRIGAAPQARQRPRRARAPRDGERENTFNHGVGSLSGSQERWARSMVYPRRFKNKKELSMRKLVLPLAASVVLLSSTAFAQTDTKAPSTTDPAAQSGDSMSKGDMSKDKMSKTKMAKKKSNKSDDKMDKM